MSTGKQFFPDMWDRVCECISDIFTASMPTELLTWKPPERLYRTQSNASLGSSFSSIPESPLPATGRPVSVASVESSAVEPHALPDEHTEVATTEAPTTPEITVIPSSPPMSKETEDKQTEVNNATLTNIPINAQDDSKNSASDNAPSDSTLTGDLLNDKTAVTDAHTHDHIQQHVHDAVTEETVENAPLLNDETDHPVSHDTPQHQHVPTSSGKPPAVVNKQAQQKEKKQKGTGSFLQRKKRGSTGSGTGKRRSNVTTSITEASNRKDSHAKKHPLKLNHLQSPDADLAKSKFNKIGTMIVCTAEYCSL